MEVLHHDSDTVFMKHKMCYQGYSCYKGYFSTSKQTAASTVYLNHMHGRSCDIAKYKFVLIPFLIFISLC